jgi:transposase
LLGQIIEEMDLHEIYQSYSRLRKNQPTPRQMLKILVYAYMNRIYSSRQIELACRRDINFMYLLEDASAPDHTTIARFRSLHFAPFAKIMLARLNQLLAENGELSLENIFIDGTKIEAAANKYTFVWKRAVTKNLQKLLDKIPTLFQNAETLFEIRILHGKFIHMYHIKKLRKRLKQLQHAENIVFVHGIGKRKSQIQRMLEQVDEAIHRLKKYAKYLHIADKRNSFSKTDHDATFMRMKEDAMKNGQLKPAYNIQFGVDAEYVVWITAGPQPTDTTTLIPFLNEGELSLPGKSRTSRLYQAIQL